MKPRAPLLFILSFLLVFCALTNGAFAVTHIWGHAQRNVDGFNPQTQSQTLDPNSNWDHFVQPNRLNPARDNGLGELSWSFFDENGITERVALSADGRWAAIGYSLNDERFELRSAENGELQFAFNVDYGNSFVDISADGSVSAYSALDSVWMFNRGQGANPIFRYGLRGYGPGPVALTRNAEYLLITGNDPAREVNRAWCFRNRNQQPGWMLEVDAAEASNWIGISIAEEARIAVFTSKFRMWVVDIITGEVIWTDLTYNSEAPAVLSSDGRVLAMGTLTGRLRVLGWDDGEGIYSEYWHYNFIAQSSAWVSAVAITPDGSRVAAGSLDFQLNSYSGRVAVFDVFGQGRPIWMSEPFADEISKVKFSADGGILAAVSWGDVDNNLTDLAVFETFNRNPFYTLSTPGSMSGLGLSDDGRRILAGGKSVHNRVFGAGGRIYIVNASYPGGLISGRIVDENNRALIGAEVTAEGNPYRALTNANGEYSLKVEVQNVRSVNLTAQRKGYMYGIRNNVQVRANQETRNIDFILVASDPPPENLRAGRNQRNAVVLQWNPYNQVQLVSLEPNPVITANGQRAGIPVLSPDKFSAPVPHRFRDGADDAERILIYRSHREGGPYSLAGTVDGDETRFADRSGLFPWHHYFYVITADFGDGESNYSNQVESWINTDFLNFQADLQDMPNAPRLDGRIEENEWTGSVERDISDAFGYDEADSAGSVTARIGFDDETDYLYLGFSVYCQPRLTDRMGVGVYVDDNGDGHWAYDKPGSEGNFWGYWVDGAPSMSYRSLCGPPYNYSPNYYQFPNPTLAFGDGRGRVEIEMGIPLGFHILPEVALYAPEKTIGL
ncbi:MAG: carboxypeptidase regulatory-like domain-containing protein, partial [Calditrichota bacterium]